MKGNANVKPFAFLSSFADEFGGWLPDGSFNKNSLRYKASEIGEEAGRHIWVAEVMRPDLKPQSFIDLEIADALWENVRACEVFICVLGGNRAQRSAREHGTPISLCEKASAVSFFEAELVLAALLGKPIHLFVADGFSPGPRLTDLLNLLSFALPWDRWRIKQSEDEILAEIRKIVVPRAMDRLDSIARRFKTRRQIAGKLLSKAYLERGIRDGRPRGQREILFLDGICEKRTSMPDKDLVQQLLSTERTASNAESKLVRLWIAIRELMACPPAKDRTCEYLPLWNEALSSWASNAAWYGLHGHIFAGQLAALFSAARVRQQLRDRGQSNDPKKIEHPGGLASALYSISKLMPSRQERQEVLLDGFEHLSRTVSERGTPDANLLQLRGSFYLRMRESRLAVADYKAALKLREREGASAGEIGESMSELGFAHLCEGRFLRGLELLRHGADLLSEEKENRAGFYARALKKLAIGYALQGRLIKARQTLVVSRQVATRQRMFDQL